MGRCLYMPRNHWKFPNVIFGIFNNKEVTKFISIVIPKLFSNSTFAESYAVSLLHTRSVYGRVFLCTTPYQIPYAMCEASSMKTPKYLNSQS